MQLKRDHKGIRTYGQPRKLEGVSHKPYVHERVGTVVIHDGQYDSFSHHTGTISKLAP